MVRKVYTVDDHLNESLKDPLFAKEWNASEKEYQKSRKFIVKQLDKKIHKNMDPGSSPG